MNNIAIIPARGGSKGIKLKNLKKVGNKSLIQRAILSATPNMEAIISTDNNEIAKEAINFGAKMLSPRPEYLATDSAKTIDVLIYTAKEYESRFKKKLDNIFLIEPTSPFRNFIHVKKTLDLIKKNKYKSVISICNLERKPENIFIKNESLTRYIKSPIETYEMRQSMNHLCRLNSAIYAVNRDSLFSKKVLIDNPIGYIEMTNIESINIDTELDLKLANLVSREYKI